MQQFHSELITGQCHTRQQQPDHQKGVGEPHLKGQSPGQLMKPPLAHS